MSKETTATPNKIRLVIDCALAWKKYADGIKDREETPAERKTFMEGFKAGTEAK